MILPAMVQGLEEEEARDRVYRMMDLLHLDRGLYDHAPTHLSGGQKQRMAFIRALCTDFDILFGDEPTGNLDPVSAGTLMALLRENLHTHRRTGLVVSHDIGLALKYADSIAVFTQHPDRESMGWLNPGHIFTRNVNEWHDSAGRVLPADMLSLLSGLIRTNK
jgi:ABC-type lipoprotein export system ATPase subunit